MINMKEWGIDTLLENTSTAIKTGLHNFDEATDGLVSGRLYVISAASGVGKTTFLSSIMLEAALKNPDEQFLFIATEQNAEEIQAKLLSNRSFYNTRQITLGLVDAEILEEANNTLDNVWFEYYDSADFDLEQCLEEAYQLGIRYVFYDYLGAIADLEDNKEWRTLEMLTDQLKRWAVRTKGFVFTATQCSSNIKNADLEETLDERYIANSKGIARKADVGFIMVKTSDTFSRVIVDMYKNRNMEAPKRLLFWIDYAHNRVEETI